uniref:Uncharacterized protein n=1 Tax=Romanomermis culicivorax TaxID=13658 RepID=A0A915JP30_ROMCU
MSIDRLKKEFCKPIVLTFRNSKIEEKYSKARDFTFSSQIVCCLIVLFIICLVQILVVPKPTSFLIVSLLSSLYIVGFLTLVSLTDSSNSFCNSWKDIGLFIKRRRSLRNLVLFLITSCLYAPVLAQMFSTKAPVPANCTVKAGNLSVEFSPSDHVLSYSMDWPLYLEEECIEANHYIWNTEQKFRMERYALSSIVLASLTCSVFLFTVTTVKLLILICLLSTVGFAYFLVYGAAVASDDSEFGYFRYLARYRDFFSGVKPPISDKNGSSLTELGIQEATSPAFMTSGDFCGI